MEAINLNWWAILLAAASSLALGWIWYAEPVFGKMWQKLARVHQKPTNKSVAKAIIKTFIVSLLSAIVLAHMAALANAYYEVGALAASVTVALWLWAGLSAATVVMHDSFEQRPAKLTLITVGYQLIMLITMGIIIGLFGGF